MYESLQWQFVLVHSLAKGHQQRAEKLSPLQLSEEAQELKEDNRAALNYCIERNS